MERILLGSVVAAAVATSSLAQAPPPAAASEPVRAAEGVVVGTTGSGAARPVVAPPLAAPAVRPWLDTSLPATERARRLVTAMSLEEKISLLSGSGGKSANGQLWQVHVKGIPRLGIPDMTEADTPAGLLIAGPDVVQMPNGSALGATFSREDAFAYGATIGAEARAMGYGVLNGPNLDVNRDPRHGRAHETFGEDPVLTGRLGVAFIDGVQSRRVIADAKHFVVNTVEKGRMGLDVRIDPRTLHELYLPPFREAVEDGHVGMVMCAYNKINGVQACDRADLLNGLLRGEWGFEGVVRGDGGADHALESITAGMDQELPVPQAWGTRLLAAVKDGKIPVVTIDTAVERVLRTMMVYGVFDDPPVRTGADLQADSRAAERIAAHSAVLLKNQGSLLPLSAGSIRRLAVIGAAADDSHIAGGPANPNLKDKITILAGIRSRAKGVAVDYEPGVDPLFPIAEAAGYPQIGASALAAKTGESGAAGMYYDAKDGLLAERTDACLCYADVHPLLATTNAQTAPRATSRIAWTSRIRIEKTGDYGFDVVSNGDAELKIDGRAIASTQQGPTPRRSAATLHLRAGMHRLEVAYVIGDAWRSSKGSGTASTPMLKIGWRRPPGVIDDKIAAAVAAARKAEVAVVVVRDFESEAMDRASLTLPDDQDRLIEAVAAANPRTVVVLTTGAPVLMPWLVRTRAVIEAWYGGARAGPALASVLFGDVTPSGRLPFTFPMRDADLSTGAPERFPGDGKVIELGEGLSTGYRRFTAPGAPRPLFPFGYGLSYTTFAYSGLTLDHASLRRRGGGVDATFNGQKGVTATFTVRNTGGRAGSVTPQVYVEFPAAAREPAPLLKGFEKVELAPGESKTISVAIDQQAFSVFDDKAGGWRIVPGTYRVRVADSSAARPMVRSFIVH